MALHNTLFAKRYEPPAVDLTNRNSAHTLIVELTGTGKTVLEVGTATGYLTRILRDRGNRVFGVEIDAEAATMAARYCERILTGDVEELNLAAEFEPESFDVIIFGDVLEHLKWPENVLRKVRPLLKPDGYLVVSLPNVTHGDVILHLLLGRFPYTEKGLLDATHLRFFGPEDVAALFQKTGYEIRELQTTHLDIGGTELKPDLSRVPGELVATLRELPQAQTYQFLFKAYKSAVHATIARKIVEPDLIGAYDRSRYELHAARERIERLEFTLRAVEQSRGWKALQAYRGWRNRAKSVLGGVRRVRPAHVGKLVSYCRRYGIRTTISLALRRMGRGEIAPKIEMRPLVVPQLDQIRIEEELPLVEKTISVVIPTKNAGPEFGLLLRKLRAQKGVKPCEIVVVDSGSQDDTLALAREAGAQVIEISPESFTHSYARNCGADHACGDYLLFMVQDAMPTSDRWLWEICQALERNDVAAVSCAEYPRGDADLFYRLLIWNHYKTLNLDKDRILAWDESCVSHMGLRSNAQINDIAGLIRADVFRQYKFRRDYAEDLDLGIRLIQNGQKLGFLYSTRVVHSHNRSPFYFLKRGYVDSRFLVDVFEDYEHPLITDEEKLRADIVSLFARTNYVVASLRKLGPEVAPGKLFNTILGLLQSRNPGLVQDQLMIDDPQLAAFLKDKLQPDAPVQFDPTKNMLVPHFVYHIGRLREYVAGIYTTLDEPQIREVADALYKTLALHAGAHLAYLLLTCLRQGALNASRTELDQFLRSGV